MEVVRVFNNELSSLYEVKPPISKAKMTQITKSAIKGIKFYKHIVQSVEKFIQKCRPEYKVPGLYVVDSIVRQSRHQFGADKDVFGPRFLKNIKITFQYLYKCAEEDRSRIVRVLNLWQKNAVFASDVIQPLMDMAHPNTSAEWSLDALHAIDNDSPVLKSPPQSEVVPNSKHKSSDHSPWKGWSQNTEEPAPDTHTYAEMSKQNLEKFTKGDVSSFAEDETSRSSQIRAQSSRNSEAKPHEENAVKFNKKLLDFDYGDEEDEEDAKHDDSHLSSEPNALALSMAQNLLSNPELLRQLQQMQQSIQQNEAALKSDLSMPGSNQKLEDTQMSYSSDAHNSPHPTTLPPTCFESRLASFQQQFMPNEPQYGQTETDKDDRVIHIPPPEPSVSSRDLDERSLSSIIASDRIPQPISYSDPNLMQFQYDNNAMPFPTQQLTHSDSSSMQLDTAFPPVSVPDQLIMPNNQIDEDERVMYSMPGEPPLPPQDFDERSLIIPVEDRGHNEMSGSQSRSRGRSNRHRSRSKSPRRRRSGSHERSRRNRSRSKERERIREKEKERERERERRRKGLPPIKKGCVSVCSTTLWLGHVPKSCSEVDISDTFGPFGTILSIDMIPPRGCAYVVMDRRQDGYRILQKNRNMKIQGSSIKMAWAPGKGVKGKEFKDYWDVDLGVSYVPFDKIRVDTVVLDLLEEGGFIDEESLSDNLKALRGGVSVEKPPIKENKESRPINNSAQFEMTTQPAMVAPSMIPTSVSLPMVLPHLMQHQFGIHLPGLIPPQAMVMPVPMGIPPPNQVLMVQQQSQGLLSSQGLPVGVPQMVPRGVPPVPQALKALKTLPSSESSLDSPIVPANSGPGDATPTEEDGTSISSPSTTMMNNASSNSLSISSMPQFNQMMNLHNANRPMLAVPPPTSSAGTPIPFPPPNVGFGFPPPGMRHAMPGAQGHGMGPLTNAQFPWMQNPADADIAFSNSGSVRLPHMSQSSGVPHPLFNIRPQFNDSQTNSPTIQNLGKDIHDSKQREMSAHEPKPPNDGPPNRNSSPPPHDKMHQEMVISTDDDESMDQDYARNDVPLGPRFPGGGEFMPRNMGMPWMRGPPPGVMQGPRFPRGGMPSGPRFNPRMGGPRSMGGPGMHLRQEMDFGRHPDDRGHRMGMGGPPPHQRRDMMPHGGPDWYPDPRDFEPPVFDRDPGRWFPPNDDRGHGREGPWVVDDRQEMENRRGGRDRDWNRDRVSDRLPKPDKLLDNKFSDSKHEEPKPPFNSNNNKPKSKPNEKDLMNDIFRLRNYSQDKRRDFKTGPVRIVESDRNTATQNSDSSKSAEQQNEQPKQDLSDSKAANDDSKSSATESSTNELNSKRERDREARKRSRWGRTLSEEREFQQQKRNEIELKFQSYELSHSEQQSSVNGEPEPNGTVPESIEPCVENETEHTVPSLPVTDNSQSEDILQTPIPVDGETQLQCAQSNPIPLEEVMAVTPVVESESDFQEPCTQTTESLEASVPAPVSLES